MDAINVRVIAGSHQGTVGVVVCKMLNGDSMVRLNSTSCVILADDDIKTIGGKVKALTMWGVQAESTIKKHSLAERAKAYKKAK